MIFNRDFSRWSFNFYIVSIKLVTILVILCKLAPCNNSNFINIMVTGLVTGLYLFIKLIFILYFLLILTNQSFQIGIVFCTLDITSNITILIWIISLLAHVIGTLLTSLLCFDIIEITGQLQSNTGRVYSQTPPKAVFQRLTVMHSKTHGLLDKIKSVSLRICQL